MKKIIYVLPIVLILISVSFVQAKNESGQNTNTGGQTQQQTQQQLGISPSATGNQVRNQNQVNTQNQEQESQLQVNTKEQENLGQGQREGLQNRNENAVANMSEVAKQVQQLLQVRTSGGIGEQVRQIAQEQTSVQTKIQDQLNKLDSKGKFARLLTGTNHKTVENLKQEIVSNQVRIEQLSKLQNQLTNQSDITMVAETIQALTVENISLQERINSEEQTKSMFGWLFRFFNP
ncbi:hypothetical protein WDW89_25220 [Deltaproteobacteria bacterium TL4]